MGNMVSRGTRVGGKELGEGRAKAERRRENSSGESAAVSEFLVCTSSALPPPRPFSRSSLSPAMFARQALRSSRAFPVSRPGPRVSFSSAEFFPLLGAFLLVVCDDPRDSHSLYRCRDLRYRLVPTRRSPSRPRSLRSLATRTLMVSHLPLAPTAEAVLTCARVVQEPSTSPSSPET